jgi:ribosomal protein L16 Arg81 hydroxylase
MKSRRRQRGQVMLIILGALFLGAGAGTGIFASGKSIESLRKEVGKMQLDEPRREHVHELLDQWEAIAEPAHQEFDEYGQTLLGLVAQRDASREEFQSVLGRQREELELTEAQLLPLREALRAALDEEEWKRLFQ